MKKSIMTKTVALAIILGLASFILFRAPVVMAVALAPDGLIYMTEEYPPFNFKEKGKLQGITVDLLEEIWKRTNAGRQRDHIRLEKWTTGYQAALKNSNTVLFATTRTRERENLFLWAGPIAPTKIVVIARKDRRIKINSFRDLKNYRIAALRDDIGEQLLVQGGISRQAIVIRENAQDIINMLEAETVDLWAYEETAGLWLIKHTAGNPGNFQGVYPLYEGELYFAFNKKTPERTVRAFQQSIDDLKKEKTRDGFSVYERIFDHYLKPRYVVDRVTNGQVMQMVDRTAADLAKDAAGTIRKINAGEHPYRDKDNRSFYVFMYDTAATIAAHGDNIKLVGRNFKGKTDVNGKAFRDEIVAKAQQNISGWEDYVYTNPGESGLYYKTTYFKLAKGSDGKTYIVCAGKFKDKP